MLEEVWFVCGAVGRLQSIFLAAKTLKTQSHNSYPSTFNLQPVPAESFLWLFFTLDIPRNYPVLTLSMIINT